MARLIVKLHGQETAQLELLDGQEYIAGRASDCAIVLNEQKGISRQHFKICQRDGVWCAESLSRFVPLQLDGEPQQSVELEKETAFFAHPYEFVFVPTPAAPEEPKAVDLVPPAGAPVSTPPPEEVERTEIRGNLEATQAGVVFLVPYLRVQYPTGEAEILKLEGDLWTAGRDNSAEICLKNNRISRHHFEISRTKEGFFLTDLGSSNGTKLNGQRLPPDEPTRLDSGDLIEVLQIEMLFEIRDQNLFNKLMQLPASTNPMAMGQNWNQPPYAGGYPGHPQGYPLLTAGPAAQPVHKNWKEAALWKIKNYDYKKNKVRVLLVALLPILLIGMFTGGKSTDQSRAPSSKETPAFDKLTPEQKIAVKDTFNLARNLYVQGKYELCLAEIAKLNELLPQYENSREIGDYCEQGRELVKRQKDNDRREHEKQMLEEKIAAVIEGCREKLKNSSSVEDTTKCLADAVELNPSHPAIAEMIQNAQAREDEQKILREQRLAREAKTAKGQAEYRRAKKLYEEGQLAKALREYQKFINTPFPNLAPVKETAKREMASIKKKLEVKVSKFTTECRFLGEKGKYREAYRACDSALKEDPDNEDVKDLRGEMLSSLRREMKAIYEDSVLEESMGNVDSAKEKWKKIVAEDLEFDEYYKRAKTLLRKYGVGI